MNIVVLCGRLAKDPEVRYAQTGTCVATITLAVDRYAKDGKKEADFIRCTLFGKQAELVGNSCKKGHRLLVNGSIRVSSYEHNGSKRWDTSVMVNSMQFIERKEEASADFGDMGSQVPFDEQIPF